MRPGEPFLEEFVDGCSCPSSLDLQLQRSDGTPIDRPVLLQPYALIGSHAQSDVVLNDPQVSPCHAYLQVIAGGVFCIDLKSQTGTHWPEGPRPFGWINPKQFLRLGDHVLRLLEGKPLGTHPGVFDPMVAGSLHQPLLTLEFSNGRTTQSQWSMNRVLALIGTASQCKVRLHDREGVLPFHASLVSTPKGTWVVDLLGPAGVYHNGEKIRCARLEDGDQLCIADFKMRVRCQPALTFALQLTPTLPQPAMPQGNSQNQGNSLLEHFFQEHSLRPLSKSATPLVMGEDNPGKALLEAVLLPLVQQFSLMQNQMFDQFREAMVMMFQMFGSLQKDQMEFIRKELGKVQELSQEIQTLQAELKKYPTSRSGEPTPEWLGPRKQDIHRELKASPSEKLPSVAKDPDAEAPAILAATKKATEGTAGPEVHAWLTKRMAEMQEDRRSRLQKILNFLSGK